MNEIVLRATNPQGVKYDLQITDVPEFLTDISTIEVGSIGSIFGITTQEFSLPGNDTNNKFFNNLFDLGVINGVALSYTVPCQIIVDSQAIFTGKLYVNNIVTDQYNNTIYNCVVTNEIIDFKTLTENKGLADLNWTGYNHPYTYASISQSWNDELFSGSVLYPLVNYGIRPDDPNSPAFEFGGNKYQMDNPNTPLKVSQFKPAVQTKTIVDEIFNSINYKYTSSFFNSTFFKNLYVLSTNDDNDGVSFASSASGSYVYAATSQSVASGFTTLSPTQLRFSDVVYNEGTNFDLASDSYTADYTGTHVLNFNIPFTITSNVGALTPNRQGRQFILYVTNGVGVGNTIYINKTPLWTSVTGSINSGDISLDLTAGQQLYFYFALQTPSANGIEQFTTKVDKGQNGVYLKVQTPTNPIGGTVNVGNTFGDIKILDFMKGLIHKFNLIMEPLQDNPNIIKIEPYNDWINQGRVKDWSDIVDRNVKFQIEHPAQQLPKTFTFTDKLDEDWLNTDYNLGTGRTYGDYVYQSNSDLPSGEETIGDFFGATPVKQLPVAKTNGTTVVPWLVKAPEAGKYAEGFKFTPRLLHKTPKLTIPGNELFGTFTGSLSGVPTGSKFYYIDDPTNSAIRAVNQYRTLLPTTDSPTDFTGSLDLHYANLGHAPFQQSVVNGQCRDGVYNRYWSYYINSLYDVDARLLTCNIKLEPSIIKDIKLNDRIFIDGHYYRINKINGANLIKPKSTEVQLIKLLSGVQGYTGKRRISTGLNPEDFVDVVTGDITSNGKVTYNNANTGQPITSSVVLDQLGTLDGFSVLDNEVVWNTQQPIDVYTNVLSTGINKYSPATTNAVFVGTGNDISANSDQVFVFGNNNTVSDAANNVMVFAQTSSILESNDVYLIQPSGSRIVSGSSNNVVINPINDITPNDPTGAVYTGNLINQGTADMKNGMSATGSVSITGSLCVNGECFPTQPLAYASFFSQQDQPIEAADTPQSVRLDGTYINLKVNLSGSGGIVFDHAGVYQFICVAQVSNLSTSAQDATFWLKYDDIDLANSATLITLPARKGIGNPSTQLMTFTFMGQAQNDGDKIELWWQGTSTDLSLQYEPQSTYPATPSVIANISPIR